jgi:hypothetical protein
MTSVGQVGRSNIALAAALLLLSASAPAIARAEEEAPITDSDTSGPSLDDPSPAKGPKDSWCFTGGNESHRFRCVPLWFPAFAQKQGKNGEPIFEVLRALPNTKTVSAVSDHCERCGPLVYRNRQFGFTFSLPRDWEGYSVVMRSWSGGDPNGSPGVERGPEILIRHPKWSSTAPREDIPIMIFTRAQWELVSREKIIVSAAPFGPSELGSNDRYVFALPPRFDYDELPGVEEVDAIVRGHPLHAF